MNKLQYISMKMKQSDLDHRNGAIGKDSVTAVIFVKDDFNLLVRNIRYHLSIGIDYFVICDRGSEERNLEKLDLLANQNSNIKIYFQHLYNKKRDEIDMSTERKKIFTYARNAFESDWLFLGDTDEFIIPKSGQLKKELSSLDVNHLTVNRFNAAFRPGEYNALYKKLGDIDELKKQFLVTERQHLSPEILNKSNKLVWLNQKIVPKIITKVKEATLVNPGFHSVVASEKISSVQPKNIIILHLPFTTLHRFRKKVENMRRHLEHLGHTMKPKQAWHWKRWVENIRDESCLIEEYNKQFIQPCQMANYEASGMITRIESYFKEQQNSTE